MLLLVKLKVLFLGRLVEWSSILLQKFHFFNMAGFRCHNLLNMGVPAQHWCWWIVPGSPESSLAPEWAPLRAIQIQVFAMYFNRKRSQWCVFFLAPWRQMQWVCLISLTTKQLTTTRYKISFTQLKHWHLKQIIIALAVTLVNLESKGKYIIDVFIDFCKCIDK